MLVRLLTLLLVVSLGLSVTGVLVAIEWQNRVAQLHQATPSETDATHRAAADEQRMSTTVAPQGNAARSVGDGETGSPGATAGEAYGTAPFRGEDIDADQPPAFISDDPKLMETYQRARTIYTDPSETEESRQRKIRVLQRNVGAEAVTLVLRYVPVLDLKNGSVQTFDSHMREMAKEYDSERGSPLDRDPVGATMKILFDPSPENIREMTGIGAALDGFSSSEKEEDDPFEEEERRRREQQRSYEAERAREEVRESWEDVKESWEDVGDAVDDASETLSDIFKSWREDE